jgi:hypothetical protein
VELKQQLIQLKADAYDMQHWPEPVRKRMDEQIQRLTQRIAVMEERKAKCGTKAIDNASILC